MKRLLVPALASCVVLACSTPPPESNHLVVRALPGSASEKAWEVELTVNDLRFETTSDGLRVSGPELLPISQPGEPELVGASTAFSIPAEWKYEVQFVAQETSQRESVDIAPYALCYRCSGVAPEVTRDEAIYNSSVDFPRGPFQVQDLGMQDGEKMVRLTLHPLLYAPKAKRLTTARKIKLRFLASGAPTARSTNSWLSAFGANTTQDARATRTPASRRLWVIAADAFLNDPLLSEWIQWKNEAGFTTTLVPASQTGTSTNSVLNYLRANANQTGDFVMLIGNQYAVPTFFETVGWQVAATDWPYARISEEIPFPTRFVGRVTASTTAQLHTQLQRFLDSERAIGDKNWYPRATTIASAEGYSPSDVQYARSIESLLAAQGFDTVDRFYESSHNAYPQAIRDMVAQGRSWISYFGHGAGTGWTSTNVDFSIEEVFQVDNRGRLPMIVDVACDNGAWTKLEPSFSEAWMNLEVQGQPAGSVGYFGGSVKVSWHEPAVMSVGVADYRFRRRAALMGQAVFAGQMYMLEKLGVNKLTLNNLSSYNLFGDPTLLVRTRRLEDYTMTAQSSANGGTGEIAIDLQTVTGQPVEGIYLGISSGGTAIDRVEIGSEKTITRGLPAGTADLKVTAYGNGWVTKQLTVPRPI